MSYRQRWHVQRNAKSNKIKTPKTNKTDSQIQYDQFKVALEVDLKRLSRIESHQRKDQLKKEEFLPRYRDYLEGVISKDLVGQNAIVIHNIVFALDAEDFEWAIELALFADQKGMQTPEEYTRNVKNLLCGQISKWCLQQVKSNQSPEPWASKLHELSQDWDLVDKIRAEIYRAVAYTLPDSSEKLDMLRQAYNLNDKVGVAPEIKKLQKILEDSKIEPEEVPQESTIIEP